MNALPLPKNEMLLKRRDVSRFIQMRAAEPGDDSQIGNLLVHSFLTTYQRKLNSQTPDERIQELRDVRQRRRSGGVYVYELGYQIIGTFSLIHPDANLTQAWIPHATNLRCLAIDPDFQGLALSERILEDAKQITRSWNFDTICLHVHQVAPKVAELYQRCGYQRDPQGDMQSMGYINEAYCLKLASSISTLN